MSTSTRPRSFLDLPVEVRLNIYEQVFRTTEVTIHSAPQYLICLGRNASRNRCVDLLTTARLITQEATPVFMRETRFVIKDCDCWYIDDYHLKLPLINNAVIEGRCWCSDSRLQRVLGAFIDQFDAGHRMASFVCKPTIWEMINWPLKYLYRSSFELLVKRGSQFVRNLEFEIRMYEDGTTCNVKIADHKRVEITYTPCVASDIQRFLDDFLEKNRSQLGNLEILYKQESAS